MVTGAVLAGLFVGAVGATAYGIGDLSDTRPQDATASVAPSAVEPVSVSAPTSQTIPEIVERVMPSVAYIEVVNGTDSEGNLTGGSGSGFVIREDGYLMTNHHVIEPAGRDGEITVIFGDGKRHTARVVGSAPDYDVAVIKIDDVVSVPAVTLGDSNKVRAGETAIAIGAPLGLDGTVTVGIVSSANRPFLSGGDGDAVTVYDSIQTDAAINPGNSGGPLLDSNGSVIGVNSAILTMGAQDTDPTAQSGNIGLGFAIPINSAKRVADDLIATGKAGTPIVGVSLSQTYEGVGAQVETVTAGGGAEKAGIEEGDIITQVNDRVIVAPDDLVAGIRQYAPGDTIEVVLTRDGREQTIKVTLGEKP